MPRGKRIVIEKKIKDPIISRIKSISISKMVQRRNVDERSLHENVTSIVKQAQDMYDQDMLDRDRLKGVGLFTLEEAHDELKRGGVDISFRAFGGRIERKSVKSVKIGNKRLVPKPVIEDWVALKREYYSVKDAYGELKRYEDINFRAFIGRIEKNSIPSIKIGTQRWVPREAIEGLTHISKNYYDVSAAIGAISKSGVKIKRNAFERRLDRNRIPHEKIGGRRVIAKEVLDELIQKELALSR